MEREVWGAFVGWLSTQSREWSSMTFALDPALGAPHPPQYVLTPTILRGMMLRKLGDLARAMGSDLHGWDFVVKWPRYPNATVEISALAPDGSEHGLLTLAGYDDIVAHQVE